MNALRDRTTGGGRLHRQFTLAALVSGCVAGLIGLIHVSVSILASPWPVSVLGPLMETNMALGLLLGGVGLALITSRLGSVPGWKLTAQIAAAVVMAVGVLTLVEHFTGRELGIDEMIADEPPGATNLYDRNRMVPPGALVLALAGAALLIFGQRNERGLRLAQGFAMAVCVISMFGVVGQLYDVQPVHGLQRLTAMPLPTALVSLLLGIGLLSARPAQGFMALVSSENIGGVTIRWLVAPTLVLLLLLGWLRLWGERQGFYESSLGTGLLVTVFMLFFCGLVYATAHVLNRVVRAEHQSRQALHRHAKLIDLTPAAIVVRHLDGTIVFWSEGAETVYGWTREEALGQQTHALLHTQFPEPIEEIVERVKREGRWSGELRHRTRDGRVLVVQSWWLAQYTPEGELTEVLESNLDVTSRKQAEQAARQTRATLEAALASMTDAAAIADAEGRLIEFNDAFVAFHRFQDREMCSRAISEPTDHFEFRSAEGTLVPFEQWPVLRALQGETRSSAEFVVNRKDTGETWVGSYSYGPIRNRQGNIIGAVMTGRDITERKRAEEALRHAGEELARANAELDLKVQQRTSQLLEANSNLQTFANTAAHDLRSPLRSISSFSTIVLQDYSARLDEAGRHLLAQIGNSADQMNRLLNDLLDYSRMTQAEIRLRPVDLHDAAREALTLAEADIKNSKAEVSLQDSLPPVMAHPATLVLIINNFVSNALKFVAPEVTPRIRICAEPANSAENRGRFVCLSVVDNGIGIEPHHMKKLFAPFQRLNSKRMYPGTGLGLAIVRRGAERMGGRVGAESVPGGGSRFWLELPAATEPAPTNGRG